MRVAHPKGPDVPRPREFNLNDDQARRNYLVRHPRKVWKFRNLKVVRSIGISTSPVAQQQIFVRYRVSLAETFQRAPYGDIRGIAKVSRRFSASKWDWFQVECLAALGLAQALWNAFRWRMTREEHKAAVDRLREKLDSEGSWP